MKAHDIRVMMHDYLHDYKARNSHYTEAQLQDALKYYRNMNDQQLIDLLPLIGSWDFNEFKHKWLNQNDIT